nr:hypothetical protein HK105_006544 [Polyrhizophydium stewartii]
MASRRRGYRAAADDDDDDTLKPSDMLNEEEQDAVIDNLKKSDDNSNLVFKIMFTLLSWSFAFGYVVSLLYPTDPSEEALLPSERTHPRLFVMSLCVSLAVTTLSPVLMFVVTPVAEPAPEPASETPVSKTAAKRQRRASRGGSSSSSTPQRVLPPTAFNPLSLRESPTPLTKAFYAAVLVAAVPLASMLAASGLALGNTELSFWGLPVINVIVVGFATREMARVHGQIGTLEDKKYKLKGV